MSDSEPELKGDDATVWEHALEDMRELAAEREADGWETVTVQAGETTPEPPSAGASDRFGVVYTIPDNAAAEVQSVTDVASVEDYTVYRRQLGSRLFLVTELADSESEVALFVAGAVNLDIADELFAAATERGEMYTHLQLLDWTHIASFCHDDPAAFIPEDA
jgi:hypothetical protein